MTIPRAPKGAGPAGRRLWSAVAGEFELGEHERALLVALACQVDRLDALEAARGTVAKAVRVLVDEGRVRIVPGRGAYVTGRG